MMPIPCPPDSLSEKTTGQFKLYDYLIYPNDHLIILQNKYFLAFSRLSVVDPKKWVCPIGQRMEIHQKPCQITHLNFENELLASHLMCTGNGFSGIFCSSLEKASWFHAVWGSKKKEKVRSDNVTIAENRRILSGRPKKKDSQFLDIWPSNSSNLKRNVKTNSWSFLQLFFLGK